MDDVSTKPELSDVDAGVWVVFIFIGIGVLPGTKEVIEESAPPLGLLALVGSLDPWLWLAAGLRRRLEGEPLKLLTRPADPVLNLLRYFLDRHAALD